MSVPAGYLRRPATAEDAARAAAVVRAFEEHATGAAETTVEDVADWWRELDPATDVWLLEDGAGTPVAYAALFRDGESRMQADGYVLPAARNRGLGRYLVDSTEARAVERDAVVLTNGVIASDEAGYTLLVSAGYTAARRFARLVIEMESAPEPTPLPDGVSVRPFQPGADDQLFHALLNEAFAEHWGHAPETLERWRTVTMGSPRFDPSLWFLAEDGGTPVGIVRCTWKESDIGWVNDLGVLPRARRRGIALGLLTRAFAEFYARGERTVGLGVDTQNETGATHLYERAGMHAAYTAVIFEKRLS